MRAFMGFLAAVLVFSTPALAQRGGDHKRDAPPRRAEPATAPPADHEQAPARRPAERETSRSPQHGAPRLHVSGNVWLGHEHDRDDARFHQQSPWAHGRFHGRIGSNETWHLRGGTPGRFYVGAGYFRVARWEYGYVNNWYWDRDEILFFDDPDAEGWYVAYNVRLGTSVHVVFLGN